MKKKIFGTLLVMLLSTMPITAQATEANISAIDYGEIDVVSASDLVINKNTKLTQDKVVAGNLYVRSDLDLNGYNLEVKGDMFAEEDVFVDGGEKLTVVGDYMQKARCLEVDGESVVTIGGDLRLHSTDANGKKVMGTGFVRLRSQDCSITVNGDMIMNTDSGNNLWATSYTRGAYILKGDLIQEYTGSGFLPRNIVLAGEGDQTLSLLRESALANLRVKNGGKVFVTDWFSAYLLGTDMTIVAKNKTIRTTALTLAGKTLEVEGDLLADADVVVGSGKLKVRGEYWQKGGALQIADGQASISKDLCIQTTDESGKAITGKGYLQITDPKGSLTVGGTMLLNTTSSINGGINGKITVRKDFIQKHASTRFKAAYIYMAGTGAQKVSFKCTNSLIETLELGQHISKYTFRPNTSWNKLIEVVNPFADVDVKSWQFPYVKYALDENLMAGKGTSNAGKAVVFEPNKNMTRAEFVQTLYNKEGKPAVSYKNVFVDVPKGKWYTNAVMWAYQNDIVKGKSNRFDVEGNITREEMATILYKYAANYKGYEAAGRAQLTGYTDAKSISSWATENMKWAIQYGIMKGKGNLVAPKDNATRAEGATMLRNFIIAYED